MTALFHFPKYISRKIQPLGRSTIMKLKSFHSKLIFKKQTMITIGIPRPPIGGSCLFPLLSHFLCVVGNVLHLLIHSHCFLKSNRSKLITPFRYLVKGGLIVKKQLAPCARFPRASREPPQRCIWSKSSQYLC